MSELQSRMAFGPDEAAKLAGVGRTTIFGEIKARRLTARKAGGRTLISADDLKTWLDRLPRVGEQAA